MRKPLFLLLILLLTSLNLQSLDINDPADNLYRDLEYWQELGFYRHLPPSRPYSAQFILALLDKVIAKGKGTNLLLAEEYHREISRGLRLDAELEVSSGAGRQGLAVTTGTANFFVRGMISDKLSVWGQVSANGVIEQEPIPYYMYDPSLPYGERSESNVVQDISVVGDVAILQASTGILSYGTENLFFNVGVSRGSFGPNWGDGIVISDEANVQGRVEMTWRKDHFSYSVLFLELFGSDYEGRGTFPEKYMTLHSYNWAPFDWLEMGFFESVVFGGRIEPMYLFPFTYMFVDQGLVGFADNSLLGLQFRSLMPGAVEWTGIIYVDDLGFNELVKFNFDTKIKIALETGFSWTPASPWLDRISLDYAAVFPYMYTHSIAPPGVPYSDFSTGMNYDNYSHAGKNLGVSLSPNSDRVAFMSRWRLTPRTELNFTGNWIRHGNASSENVDNPDYDEVPTDGSLWDNGHGNDGSPGFVDENEFLTQDVLEKVLQLGCEIETQLLLPASIRERTMVLELGGGYTFEKIWNSGRGSGSFAPVEGNHEENHYLSFYSKWFY